MIDWTCLSVSQSTKRSSSVKKRQNACQIEREKVGKEKKKRRRNISNNSLRIDGRFFQLIIIYRKEDAKIQNFRLKVFQKILSKFNKSIIINLKFKYFIIIKIENYYLYFIRLKFDEEIST